MNAKSLRAAAPITAFCVFLGISGCLSRSSTPPTRTYAFSRVDAPPIPGPGQRVLAIRSFKVSPPYDARSFLYRTGPASFVRDPYAQFLAAPSEELPAPIIQRLRRGGNFSDVTSPGGLVEPNVLAEASVTELYGDFRPGERPAAIFSIRFVFVEAPGGLPGKVILAREYSRNEFLSERTASALMAGWNHALDEILAEVNRDLTDELSADRPPPSEP
jgi:hypothetical protein